MNLKQLGILLTAVIVIGGAALYFHNRQDHSFDSGSPEMGKKLLGNFQVNDVAHIAIKDGTNELNLEKKNDLWRVHERGDYPANFSQISEFLLKARDLKIVQTVDVGPSQLSRVGLASGQGSNTAVVVEFKDQAEKSIRTLLLGKKHMKKSSTPSQFGGGDESFPDGRYVKVGDGAASDVVLISDPLDNMEAKPDQWLDKDFFRVEKAKSIEVVFPAATNSWKLTRDSETSDWKLANAKKDEELDSSKVSGVSSPFSSPNFSDVIPGAKLEGSGTNKPTTVKIATFDNFDYTITLGAKTNDDYLTTVAVAAQLPTERTPAKDEKPADKARLDKEFKDAQQKLADKLKQEEAYQQWTYEVPSWVVDPVLKPRGELLAEKKEEPKKTTTGSTEQSTGTNHVDSATAAKN